MGKACRDPMDFTGRVVVVTGGTRGVGRGIAQAFLAAGADVVVCARHAPDELPASSGRAATFVAADVRRADEAHAVVAAATERHGRLDVLVNNAGISGDLAVQTPGTADLAAVRAVFETNFFGVIMVTDAFLPMLRRSRAARIVNVSSGVGSLHHMTDPGHYMSKLPGAAAYPTSKTALNALTVQYAKVLAADNILVNAVAPGPCATDFTRRLPYRITRTAAQGAEIAVRLATVGPDGPTGGFSDDDGPVPW